jgi:hypothetical protein
MVLLATSGHTVKLPFLLHVDIRRTHAFQIICSLSIDGIESGRLNFIRGLISAGNVAPN